MYLEVEDLKVLLPVICTVHTEGTVGSVKSQALGRVERPASDVDLATSLIGENQARSTENVALHMHFAPCLGVVLNETEIELVRARRVGECRCTRLLEEGDLIVNTDGGDERDD